MMKFDRLLSREDFLQIIPQNSIGAEIGVFKGEFSNSILSIVKPKELHLIDVWWKLYGEFYPDWGEYTNFGKLRTKDAYNLVLQNISAYESKSIIHVGNSIDILQKFPNSYFDWVYLDSSHQYEETKNELNIIKNKTKQEGLITGHDWNPVKEHPHYGAYKAIKEFCQTSTWRVVYIDSHTQWCLMNTNSYDG